VGYVLAVLLTAIAMLVRWAMTPFVGESVPYQFFYISLMLVAVGWGRGPGLLAIVLGSLGGTWLFALGPDLQGSLENAEIVSLTLYLGVGSTVTLIAGRLRSQKRHVERQRELLSVTLASVGEGVIATDLQGRVAFLNREAERLTGWTNRDAVGQPVASVFRIISQHTRQPVTNPTDEAWESGAVSRVSSQWVLIAKDGRETSVENRGAAIQKTDGTVHGRLLVFRDNSLQEEAEIARRKATELRQLALDAAEMGTWELDPQSFVCTVDARCQAILHLPDVSFHYDQFMEVVFSEDRQCVKRVLQAAIDPASDGRYDVEHRVVGSDGAVRWVAGKGQAFFQGEGQSRRAVRVVGMVMDITAAKEAEEKLRASEELFRAFFDNAAVAAALLEPEGLFLQVNDRYCQLTGYSREELLKMTPVDLYPPDDRLHYQDLLTRFNRGESPTYNVEQRRVRKDGTVIWLQVNMSMLRDRDGRPLRMAAMAQDVTGRKEAEESLRTSEELLQQAVCVSGLGTFLHNERAGVLEWSPRTKEMLGVGPEEPRSIPRFLECVHPEDRARVALAIQGGHDPSGDGLHVFECRVQGADGTVRWLNLWAQTFFEGEGELRQPVRTIGMVMDVTDRKKAEEELRTSEELLQQAVRVSGLGIFNYYHPPIDVLEWSPGLRKILGVSAEHPVSIAALAEITHSDDRQKLAEAQARSSDPNGDGLYLVESRVLWPDGTVRWLSQRGQTFFEGEGPTRRPVHSVGVVADITESKLAEEKLRASEELFRAFFDNAAVGSAQVGLDGRFLQVNDRYCQITGYSREELLKMTAPELFHPDERQYHEEGLKQFFQGQTSTYEAARRYVRKDGAVIWVHVNGSLIRDHDGRPLRLAAVIQDVTARKRAEEELRTSEELLQQAIRVSGLGIFDYHHDIGTVEWSPKLRVMRGFGPDEAVSVPAFLDRVHPEDRQRVADAIVHSMNPSGDGLYFVENRLLMPDGTVRWFSQQGQTFFEGEGAARKPVRTVGAVADITDSKRAEEELRASEQLFRAFFGNAAVGTSLLEPGGRFLQVNDRYCQITGYSREEILTMSPIDLCHPDDRARYQEHLTRFYNGQIPIYNVEQRRVRKDGSVFWVQVNGSLMRDEKGRLVRVAGMIQDITERKKAEEALAAARQSAEEAKAVAEAASQAKSQFLAHMSHELRTPMNAILGMTELALQESLSAVVRDSLQTVKDSADSLLVLINEVLDLSRIEAGAMLLESHPFSLRTLLDETLRAIAMRAFEKNLELACQLASKVPDRLVGDAMRLRQILTNLLGNAIKFTERGEVVVKVDLERECPEEVRLRFAVIDTGIGIAPEHQQRIFAPFTQADLSMTRRFGGSGLGLSIVSRLVEMLGGEVGLESQLEHGSTFFFTVGLRRQDGPEHSDSQQLALQQLKGHPLLVADRHGVNRRVLEQTLSDWAIRPVLAHDAFSALSQLREAADAGRKFPLAILDASMPGVEELHLLEQIHTDPQITTVVVLTVSPAQRQQILRQPQLASTVVFLEKPLSPMAIASALSQAQGLAGRQQASQAFPGQTASSPLRVLLAEDTPANQKLAVRVLSRRGHMVEVAQNGLEAVERLRCEPFDIVLMDVQMPVMDGFQATNEIRGMDSTAKARIPIIAMTAHALKGDQEKCLAAGMDAYISKPIDVRELVALVERVAAEKAISMADSLIGVVTHDSRTT
jgi:PAS domain S-box-containing protein